jgi:uncharacterized SAM-binding protein YcdF (DUF218 family)
MARTRLAQARRVLLRAAVFIGLAGVLAAAAFLPFAGRYLSVETPLEPADVLFVLAGARVERWLEAADLYREGVAPRIIISPGRIEDIELELRRRGIRFPAEAELIKDAMVQLGVPADAVSILPRSVDNTAQEAGELRRLAESAGWQRIIVITSKYHTRRAAFAFERDFRGSPVRILVRGTRYDRATPERWWTERSDIRFVTSELQKLLAYRLGLGG